MSDQSDIYAALLRRFADFTRKLTDEELLDVANGNLKFILDRPAQRRSVATPIDADEVGRALGQMSSRTDAAAYIDRLKLTVPQLKDLARQLDVGLVGAMTKVAVRDRIVEHRVGHRLNSEAIRGGAWADR